MATMQEIAELAGVSRGTVDRVLNNRGGVNDATRDKILEIKKLLNYEPNRAGLALATQKKDIKIGVLSYGAGNPFFDEVKRGMDRHLKDLSIYGCELIYRQTRFNLKEQLAAFDEITKENLTGLIITPYDDEEIRKRIRSLTDRGIPVVTLNSDISDCGRIAYVSTDSYRSGQTVAGLLGMITNGHAEVGILTGSRSIRAQEIRIRGFKDIIKKKYPGIHIEAIEECFDDDYKSYESVQRMKLEYPTIDAFFFSGGAVYGGCKALHQMTTRQKFTVITLDDSDIIKDFMQKDVISATICLSPFRQGFRSLSILAEYILFGKTPEEEENMLDISIKIKESL